MDDVKMFDADSYTCCRRPHTEARSLPGWCYTSATFHEREREAIFRKNWNLAGRQSQVENVGDYFTVTLFGHDILVTRAKDGCIHAFLNGCRHRGTRLKSGAGNCRRIVCPLHRWAYGLDGRLHAAPHMEKTTGFSHVNHGLRKLRVETWGGFVFVNFDPDAPSLLSTLGELPDRLRPYELERMTCVRTKSYEVKANWKLYIEVDMESYHTPHVHPQSIGGQDVTRMTGHGEYETIFMPGDRTISVPPSDRGPVFEHIAGLADGACKGTYFSVIYPSLFVVATLDSAWWIYKTPRSPHLTDVHVGFLFPPETAQRPDFDEIAQRYYRRWDQVIEEDNDIVEVQHAGIAGGAYIPGPFADREVVLHAMDNWILDRVLGLA